MNISYPKAIIHSHWLTVILVAIAYLTSGNPVRDGLIGQIHVLSGMGVALMLLMRIPLRVIFRKQIPVHQMALWQKILAHLMQLVLYVMMLLIPMSGMLALSSNTMEFSIFGLPLPLLMPSYTIDLVGSWHESLGNAFITLAGLHALAALIHHFYYKDNVLRSMKP